MSSSISDIEVEVFLALCWKVGTPLAYKAICLVEHSDWLGLSRLTAEPAHYMCPITYLGDAQVCAFFKKYPGFDLGYSLKERAIESFWASERQCFRTNERLSPLLFDLGHYGERVRKLLVTWRKEIRFILGRAPLAINLDGKFGPGSTFLNRGDEITLAHKLTDDYTATLQARSFLHSWDLTAWSRYAACGLDSVGDTSVAESHGRALFHSDPHAVRDFSFVRGNRFTTVPKDSTKDRGICVEPSLNVFYQLAVGQKISDRMKKTVQWDKVSCQAFHKVLAQLGSLTGATATIDLSSASDTLCINLVKLILPPDWYDLVDRLRSTHTLLNGKWVRLEKFSSMGNGYTFELETLLFLSLGRVLASLETIDEDPFTPGLTVSVFGDDIIVPTSISRSMIATLGFFGFTPNKAKTFTSGPFRESCGGDFFAGHDVRPHFQKEICEQPHQLIALANGIRRFGRRYSDLSGRDAHLVAWFRCVDALPRQISICRGPESLGDLVVHDSEEHWRSRNPIRVRSSIRYLRVWRPVSNRVIGWEHFRPGVALAVALYGGSSGLSSSFTRAYDPKDLRRSGIVPRIRGSYVSGYRFGRVAYS